MDNTETFTEFYFYNPIVGASEVTVRRRQLLPVFLDIEATGVPTLGRKLYRVQQDLVRQNHYGLLGRLRTEIDDYNRRVEAHNRRVKAWRTLRRKINRMNMKGRGVCKKYGVRRAFDEAEGRESDLDKVPDLAIAIMFGVEEQVTP